MRSFYARLVLWLIQPAIEEALRQDGVINKSIHPPLDEAEFEAFMKKVNLWAQSSW